MNHLKFCGCRMCRVGRDSAYSQAKIKRVKRRFRKQTKQALARGAEPPKVATVTYTD